MSNLRIKYIFKSKENVLVKKWPCHLIAYMKYLNMETHHTIKNQGFPIYAS